MEPRTPNFDPPGSFSFLRRWVHRAEAPLYRFVAMEASSGVLLLFAAAVALFWANSPWAEHYQALWHTTLGFRFGPFLLERDLHFWINEGLMTLFFFVVGLEIRRELHEGELSELKRAALPLAAAVGGMLLPALLFLAFNAGRPSQVGWGVPMATDIAFAVGVLTLLGNRVSPAVRILLLALAVMDDVGAILVIALFYSSGFSLVGFAVLAGGLFLIGLWKALGVRSPWAYLVPALVIWVGAYLAGIHPTLAGVLLGLLTPVHVWFNQEQFALQAEATAQAMRQEKTPSPTWLSYVKQIKRSSREVLSPVERLHEGLHGWVAFAIMPLFALANAGVPLEGARFDGDAGTVFWGIFFGLVLGKLFGILGFSWGAAKLGIAQLPGGVASSHLSVVGLVGGIGFTMALFIAQLAFPAGVLLETAKLAILCASGVAALLALLVGFLWLPSSKAA